MTYKPVAEMTPEELERVRAIRREQARRARARKREQKEKEAKNEEVARNEPVREVCNDVDNDTCGTNVAGGKRDDDNLAGNRVDVAAPDYYCEVCGSPINTGADVCPGCSTLADWRGTPLEYGNDWYVCPRCGAARKTPGCDRCGFGVRK